ncbi:MAG TPA: hypothetical protein VND44_13040 [Acidimicrobiales bacterium]|nr:hypothetical protein [Acidimicrobiales bacterium]
MANDSTGKWVQRAATTGGGRTYRGQMPVNFYASLAVIIIVGLGLIVFSRYQLTHKSTSSSGPPTTQQTWYAGLAVDVCGTIEPNLPSNAAKSGKGLTANGNGVVTIAPADSSQSGSNATLGKFVSGYKGLELTNSTLRYPGKPTYSNGDICPKGTPDSGKPGVVIVYSWPNFTSKQGAQTPGDPQNLLFQNGQLITMAFVPANATVPKPPASVITSLITADQSGPTTPTTAPTLTPSTGSTATTAPTSTSVPTSTTKPGGTTG